MGNAYDQKAYAKGFVLSRHGAPRAPSAWTSGRFAGFDLAHDPGLETRIIEARGISILCFGPICNARAPELSPERYLAQLAQARSLSESAFHEELGWSCGRYVLLCAAGEDLHAYTDAAATRQVFHHAQAKVLASHVWLLGRNAPEAKRSQPMEHRGGYPGRALPVAGGYRLTPNTRLDLRSFAVERYWPQESLPRIDSAEAAARVGQLMKGALEHAARFRSPVVSATAGLDSRATVALCRDIPQARFFTYYRGDHVDSDRPDRDFAQALQQETDRRIKLVDRASAQGMDPDFERILDRNTLAPCQRKVAWLCHQKFADDPMLLHLRSNVAEIGREYYAKYRFELESPRDMARLYLHPNRTYKIDYLLKIIEMFEDFSDATGFFEATRMIDAKSLFYWEFRMSSWLGNALTESDIALEAASPYNCRKVIEALLSVPREDRHAGSVQRRIVAAAWPALTRYPLNEAPFWPTGIPKDLRAHVPDTVARMPAAS